MWLRGKRVALSRPLAATRITRPDKFSTVIGYRAHRREMPFTQQQLAETFLSLAMIPHKIDVAAYVWQAPAKR